MHVIHYPDNTLRHPSKIVSQINKSIKKLGESLIKIMIENNGLGLSAPQIGIDKRIIAIRANDKGGIALINPEITEQSSETFTMKEGCLSLPGKFYEITRPRKITVVYNDIHGEEQELVAEDYASSVIQHEVDHLDGKLIIDYISTDIQTKNNNRLFFA